MKIKNYWIITYLGLIGKIQEAKMFKLMNIYYDYLNMKIIS